MVRALVATSVLSCSVAPVGAFLVLRRLSLAGEAIAHAIVPGIVIGFVFAGLSVTAMIVGGLGAGFIVALLTSLLARHTTIREDASLASLYLIALALGILSCPVRFRHLLTSFLFVPSASMTKLHIYRHHNDHHSVECRSNTTTAHHEHIDLFYESTRRPGSSLGFMLLVVLNLLGAFKALYVDGRRPMICLRHPRVTGSLPTTI